MEAKPEEREAGDVCKDRGAAQAQEAGNAGERSVPFSSDCLLTSVGLSREREPPSMGK